MVPWIYKYSCMGIILSFYCTWTHFSTCPPARLPATSACGQQQRLLTDCHCMCVISAMRLCSNWFYSLIWERVSILLRSLHNTPVCWSVLVCVVFSTAFTLLRIGTLDVFSFNRCSCSRDQPVELASCWCCMLGLRLYTEGSRPSQKLFFFYSNICGRLRVWALLCPCIYGSFIYTKLQMN